MSEPQKSLREGLIYGLIAYIIWGLVPLYFKTVKNVDSYEILAHRTFWSIVVLALLLTALKRWNDLRLTLRKPKTVAILAVSALLLVGNWYGYIVSVYTNRLLESSLGYFMLPLANVAFGMIFFGERLRPLQGLALAIAAFGIGRMIWTYGDIPWLGLFLTFSFGLYGVMRKIAPVDGLIGFTIETIVLLPFAITYLTFLALQGKMQFLHPPGVQDLWIVLAGVVTTAPLICFAQAVRRVGLISLGFIQYLSPTIQLLIAIYVFQEEFSESKRFSFFFVWVGLGIFVIDTVVMLQQTKRPEAIVHNVDAVEVD